MRALKQAVHGRRRRVQRLGDLGAGEPEHVAQDQRRPLAGRQVLQRGDERQLDRFPLLVPGVRPGESVGNAEPSVGVGLDPGRLDQRRAEPGVRVRRRAVVDRQHPRRSSLDHAQADIGRDRVQPGAQRAASLELPETAPRVDQRLLHGVLGVLDRTQQPVAVPVQRPPVRLNQLSVGTLIPGLRGVQQKSLTGVVGLICHGSPRKQSAAPRADT
jgi:hypothetical protein